MKNFFICATLLITPTIASANNVMFGENDSNMIGIYAGPGTGSGSLLKLIYPGDWNFSSMTFLMARYAQPISMFRMPGRVSIDVMQNVAYKSSDGLSFIGIGVSWDVVLASWHGFYVGAGIGPYYRDNHDRWVSSRLVFGEKFFVGKNITEHLHAELFTLHFSNGDLTETNHGFNFTGLALNFSF